MERMDIGLLLGPASEWHAERRSRPWPGRPNVIMQPVLTPPPVPRLLALLLFGALLFPGLAQSPRPEKRVEVEIRTELGVIRVELFNETPIHRDNFLRNVAAKAYDSLLFHRAIPGLLVQGGNPASKHAPPGAALDSYAQEGTLEPEIKPGLIHRRGALAAAREGDDRNPGMRSDPMQFYIVLGNSYRKQDLDRIAERNTADGRNVSYSEQDRATYARLGGTPHLDGGYTVFGQVVEGMDVVEALAALPCNTYDRPVKDVRMYLRSTR